MKGLPWFFVDAPGERVALTPSDAAHAMSSLRLRPGEEVTVCDGHGWVARGTLTTGGLDRSIVEVFDTSQYEAKMPVLRIAFAPPTGDRTWWAIQKLTELGVDEISLVEAQRSVKRQLGREAHVLRRAMAVTREAAKQSRRAFLPSVNVAEGGLFAEAPDDEAPVVLYEGAEEPLSKVLPPDTGRRISLYFGPEGGLGEIDLEQAEERGAPLASLGEANLRTETAVVAGAALALSRYGRLG